MTRIRSAVRTDVGMEREHNEDAAHADPDSRLFVVADGMGGHAAGEVASALAVEVVQRALAPAWPVFDALADGEGAATIQELLKQAVRQAHQEVCALASRDVDKRGMGTTLDAVLVTGSHAYVAHVGDGRTYLIRDGLARQLTRDHTVAEAMIDEGSLTPEEALHSPLRSVLVNAVGGAVGVGVDLVRLPLRSGDRLLLCSDGLHDYFPDSEELAVHLSIGEPAAALERVVELARRRGGEDNITGVLIDMVEVATAPRALGTEPGDLDDDPIDRGGWEEVRTAVPGLARRACGQELLLADLGDDGIADDLLGEW
jgi:protein phosphatase